MARMSRGLDAAIRHYDVIVVGSGYGGGVAASRLARAGKSVAVLERGREIETGSFPAKFSDVKSELQVTGRRYRMGPECALYDVRLGEDMHVLVGCGLGGGSLVNAGVALRPDPRILADEAWPAQISQDGLLATGFRRAERWLAPSVHPRSAEMTKFKAFENACRPLGHEPVKSTLAISFKDRVNAAGIAQPACTLCGDCCAGCNVGAKNTVALTYLPDAVRHGAEIFTQARVERLSRRTDGSWGVHVARVCTTNGHALAREISANIVILAAGTLGSTEILLRSREAGLALSDMLGRRFSANGDIMAFGYGAKASVNAVGVGYPAKVPDIEVGAVVSGQLEIRDANDPNLGINVQEGVMPSALAPVLPVLFMPNGRLLGALQSLVNGVYKGPFSRLQTFFAVSHDSASGRLQLQDGRVVVSWPGASDEPVYARLDAILTEITRNAGSDYVRNPLAGTIMGRQPATAHPLGGCAMGRERSQGVVNHKGQVFDARPGRGETAVHEGLYVVDGAVMPRSLGVNPLLTITALAERTIMHLALDYGLSFHAAPVSLDGPSRDEAPGMYASGANP